MSGTYYGVELLTSGRDSADEWEEMMTMVDDGDVIQIVSDLDDIVDEDDNPCSCNNGGP